VVYLKESFKNSNSVIEYLARYTHKIAITSHRILSYQNGRLRFKYRDYQDKNKNKKLEMDALQFMHQFLTHTLPHRFVRIRYYGLMSHRNKQKNIADCRDYFGLDKMIVGPSKSWMDLYYGLTGRDLTLCSKCKTDHLEQINFVGSS